MKIYLVGGAVRDQLLGKPIKERDWLVVGATPQQMLDLGYQQVGKDFPVFLHPETHEEYALARTERKTGQGYTGFSCYAAPDVSLEDDLKRRDLTINAIAQTETGELIDPYGGQADLQQGVLRHVSPAFVEDPLRVLRVARFATRFAAEGFAVAPETLALMQEIADQGELDHLVAERVWLELQKVLSEAKPSVFFEVLRACGACQHLFPEIDVLFGIPNPANWHPEIDTGIHTLMVVDAAAKITASVKVRVAALLHDLGKGLTPQAQWPKHHGHGAKGVHLIEQFCQRFKLPKEYKELAVLVSRYHGDCHRIDKMNAKQIVVLLQRLDAFRRPERFVEFLQATQADFNGRLGFEDKAYPQAELLRQALAAANQVANQEVIDAGFTGAAIAEELQRRRIQAVAMLFK